MLNAPTDVLILTLCVIFARTGGRTNAHLLAADRLVPGSTVCGKAYFVTNGEPLPLWEFINRILKAHDLPPVTKSVPFWLAYSAGAILETIYKLLRLKSEPPMTRFVAHQLATAHWYNIDAAKRDLGYVPRISIKEGIRRLQAASPLE